MSNSLNIIFRARLAADSGGVVLPYWSAPVYR